MSSIINTLLDPVVNFGKVTVFTGYDNLFTVISLNTDHGSKLPNPSTDGQFNLVWYNTSKYADPSDDPNVEIVRCTARAGDVLTVVRGQEGISASSKNSPGDTYKMILSQTKKTITDIKTEYESGVSTHAGLTTTHGVTSAIVGVDDSQVLTNKYIYDVNSFVIAQGLRSATTLIYTASATAPSIGQVLTATSSGEAAWQYVTVGIIPTGGILPYAGATAPSGFLLCDGSAVSRTTYAPLFSVIGTTYGIGDNSTTFNVPNFLGRVIVGAGSGSGLTTRTRGDKAGEETHVLTVAELAAHSHNIYGDQSMGSSGSAAARGNSNQMSIGTSGAGSNAAHNTMQPFGVANYIIKT